MKKPYSFTTGTEKESKPQRNGLIDGEGESKLANRHARAVNISSIGTIKTANEHSGERNANTEAYINGILNGNAEKIVTDNRKLLNGSDIPNGLVKSDTSVLSNTAIISRERARKVHNNTQSEESNQTKYLNGGRNRHRPTVNGETVDIKTKDTTTSNHIANEGNSKKVNKSYSFSVTSENGTKHKSVIIVSNSKQDDMEIDKTMTFDTPDKTQHGQGLINPAFNQENDAREVSNDENDNVKMSKTPQNNGCVKVERVDEKTSNFALVPNGESDYLQMNGFAHKTASGDVYLNQNDETAADVKLKSSKGQKEKAHDKDKLPDVSLFRLFRFADGRDKLLLVVGTLCSMLAGLAIPINLLVYGRVATGFIYYTILQNSIAEGPNSTVYMPFNPDDYDDVYSYVRYHALYFCLIGVATIVFTFIQLVCWDISQERQMRTIREKFFKAVIHNDIAWFDLHQGAELGSSFNESMHALSAALGKDVGVCIQWGVTWIGCYILALIRGWKLALACIAFSPLIILTGIFTIRWIRNLAAKETKAYAKAGAVVEQALSSIKTVIAFNGQEKESQRYDKNLKEGGTSSFFKGFAMGLAIGGIWLILYFVFTVAFGYGIKLMGDREPGFEPGNVLTIFLGVMIGSVALSQAFPFLEIFANGKVAASKIYRIIDEKPKIDSSSDKGEKLTNIRGRLELRNVCFTYPARPEVQILNNFSISVEPGQTVALVGHSGCGKSTVVQLVERFYDTNKGEVLLDGRNIKDLNVAWFREQIGLVSQEPVLFATSIKENVQHGKEDISDEQIIAAAKEANIHEFISMLPDGYDTLVGDRGTQLSGGQKQRIAIARALVRNPKILLLDEATSALDNESEAIVQKALEKAQEGRTTIIIAHRLSTIKNADKIIAIEEGRVVEQGTHSELMKKNGLYHQLVEHQMHHDSEDDEELEHGIIDSDEISHQQKSPHLTRKPFKLDRRNSGMSQKSKVDEEKEAEELLPTFSMKRVLRINSPEWLYLTVGCLFSVIAGALQPGLAFMMSEFLNVFTVPKEKQESATWVLVGIILGLGVVNTIVRLTLSVCFSRAGYKLVLRIRSLTFKSLLRQDMTFFDNEKNRVGILTSRLASDATLVQGATGSKIGNILESFAVILSSLVVAFISSWKLALVVVAFLPLMIGAGIAQGKLTMGFSKKNKGSLEQAGQICTETVENIRVVTSLTQEGTFKKKYNKLVDDLCSKAIRRTFLTSLVMGVSNSVLPFVYAAALTYGAFLVMYDGLQFYLVFRVFATITFGGMHIGRSSLLAPDFTKAKLAAARLFALMDTEPEIDVSKQEGMRLEKFDGSVEFQSVSFQYPSRPDVTVLHDISFSASPGETVALVGSSGCGKSTTVSLLERFYNPINGAVIAGSEDITSLNLKWLRSQIGLVSQEPVLFDCSIAENIAYGDTGNTVPMDRIIDVARSANIHEFISSLPQGYDTNVGSKGTQLSGGQKQRIAIARALVSNPKILLLDEATSALDSKSEKIVQEALDRAREGRTCIVIAHRLSTIQNANKIAIIHKGEVVELGTHSQLLAKKGIYYKLIQHHKH